MQIRVPLLVQFSYFTYVLLFVIHKFSPLFLICAPIDVKLDSLNRSESSVSIVNRAVPFRPAYGKPPM